MNFSPEQLENILNSINAEIANLKYDMSARAEKYEMRFLYKAIDELKEQTESMLREQNERIGNIDIGIDHINERMDNLEKRIMRIEKRNGHITEMLL